MKKGFLISGSLLLGGGVVAIVSRVLFFILFMRRESDSVGIIGGADGPTAIFLTGELGIMHIIGATGIIGIMLAFIGGMLLIAALLIHHSNNKRQE